MFPGYYKKNNKEKPEKSSCKAPKFFERGKRRKTKSINMFVNNINLSEEEIKTKSINMLLNNIKIFLMYIKTKTEICSRTIKKSS